MISKLKLNLEDTRATFVPFNKIIVMPPSANDDCKSKIHFARNKLEKIIETYEEKHVYNKECTELTNCIKSLKKHLKNKEIISATQPINQAA